MLLNYRIHVSKHSDGISGWKIFLKGRSQENRRFKWFFGDFTSKASDLPWKSIYLWKISTLPMFWDKNLIELCRTGGSFDWKTDFLSASKIFKSIKNSLIRLKTVETVVRIIDIGWINRSNFKIPDFVHSLPNYSKISPMISKFHRKI